MKQFYILSLLFVFLPVCIFGQSSIFKNDITGINPNTANPYITGQTVASGITVSGIGRGPGLYGINANDRYNAGGWDLLGLDSGDYFEFTITPNADWKINFDSFVFAGQSSQLGLGILGPTDFALRSSADGYLSSITGSISAAGTTVSLSASKFQGIVGAITFRLYASGGLGGAFSVNSFQFNGTVSCLTPQTPVLTAPSFSCSSTSFVLNWGVSQNASNYIIDIATDSGFVNPLVGYQNITLGNVLSKTVTGLKAGGTYYVRLKSGNSCATSIYSNVVKAAPPETIYTGTWSNGVPDATKNVRFSSNFNVSSSFDACSCQIDNGVAVHVDPGGVLKFQNGLDVQGSGSLTFENNASLIQVNDDAINTGSIIYKRTAAPMKNFDYTYWSSPVLGQKLYDLSPNTLSDKYFSFANGNWVYENAKTSTMVLGKGYIIRVPKPDTHYPNGEYWTGSTYAQPVKFAGVPNNGVVSILSQGSEKDNLIGNPYPSAIDADSFITANAGIIDGALNFWTHNTPIKQDGSFYIYSSDDYALYTLTGGTGIAPRTGQAAESGGTVPNGKIAVGQSFFVASQATGNFVFNNSMRNTAYVLLPGSNSQFFRMSEKEAKKTIEKNRLWLNLSNSEGAFKQLLVGYITGATNEMDNLYDGISFDGNTYVDFYSINKENKLGIQGRALPFDKTDQVPLGFKTTIDGTFEIKIDHVDGLLSNYTIFLEDKKTGILHDLNKSPYSFSTLKGEYNDRFVLSYGSNQKIIPEQEITEDTGQELQVFKQENRLNLKAKGKKISTVFIYDLKGGLIYQKNNIDKASFVISDLISKHQVLIVKTVFENGTIQGNKIIF